eukprot:11001484-Prorocentrum_lima.AAC.1
MTSSLVGSEMCIRDSFLPDSLADDGVGGPTGNDTEDINKALGDLLSKACLLYTSDAADDM